jgi:hypothetical protein
MRRVDMSSLMRVASLDQLDELNRTLCRPICTALERKLTQAASEAQPTLDLLLAGSEDGAFDKGDENDDGGLYDGGIISELLGPEGHRAVARKAATWAVKASSYAPAAPASASSIGAAIVEQLQQMLCCSGFVHGVGMDQANQLRPHLQAPSTPAGGAEGGAVGVGEAKHKPTGSSVARRDGLTITTNFSNGTASRSGNSRSPTAGSHKRRSSTGANKGRGSGRSKPDKSKDDDEGGTHALKTLHAGCCERLLLLGE